MVKPLSFFVGAACLLGLGQAGASPTAAEQPFDDSVFISKAASGGMLEVVLGTLAKGKAKTELVKAFAERMVTDHTKANEMLKKTAAAANITVPEMMSEKDQKTLDHFKNYSGSNFDKDYINHMVTDHEEDVALFRQASKEAKNPAVKEFATKTLPVLEEHLKLAKKIQSME